MITVIAGGVGAARFLRGLFTVVDQKDVTVIGNVGDDLELYGLHISPDLDTVTYTTAEAINTETGWGLSGETWHALEALGRYGEPPWFGLGDKDLATHLYRTSRLADGLTLSEVTAEITASWGLDYRLIPMTNDPVRSKIELFDGKTVDFQEYFVRLRHQPRVVGIDYAGVDAALPAPGVIDAIHDAEVVIIAPSNPLLSIGPIVAMRQIADALADRRSSVVGISPIVGGAALKGPADHLLAELGYASSVVGVAHLQSSFLSSLVIDHVDAALCDEVAALHVTPVVTDTIMADLSVAGRLAITAIEAARSSRDLR